MEYNRPVNEGEIFKALCSIVGRSNVSNSDVVTVTYGFDASPTSPSEPAFVVLPRDVIQVKHILEVANRYRLPVTPLSGGVNVGGTAIPTQGGIVLDLKWMNKILEVNTDAAYVVIEPGVTYDELTAELAKRGFRCHIPTSPGGSTPIGNQLMRPSGSLANRHIDSIIGLEVVLPNGNIIRTGSAAFPFSGFFLKYGPFPDLSGLFCCAHGTLGVVTKASIRIYPVNEDIRLAIASFDSFSSSISFVKEVCRRNIAEHLIIWNRHLYKSYEIESSVGKKLEVPAILYEDPRESNPDVPYNVVTVHMSGFKVDMETHERVVGNIAAQCSGKLLSKNECETLILPAIKSWEKFYIQYHISTMDQVKKYGLGRYVPWIVMGEPKDIIEIEKESIESMNELGLRPICYYSMPFDYGRAIFFRIFTYIDPREKETLNRVGKLYQDMYDLAAKKYGAIPFRHRRDPRWLNRLGGYQLLLRSIKEIVDPNNIMNPGVGIF
jgi:glycolate oxidase